MNALTLTIPVENGKLAPTPGQAAAMETYLRSRDGKAVTVKLSRPGSTRSLQANAHYWGFVLTPIAQHCGISTEDAHEIFREKFLPRRFVKIGSIERELRKTTTELSPTEFAAYVQQVIAFAGSELGLVIPSLEQAA